MLNSVRYTLVFRGVLALIVGLVAVGWPEVTVGVFVLMFAVYALVAAAADVVAAFRSRRAGSVIGYILLSIASVAAGLLTLAWPDVTVQVFVLIVAGWALAGGAVQIFLAFRAWSTGGERAMWTLGGLVSIAFAVAVMLRPTIAAEGLATVFGLFSMIHGIALLTFAAQTRKSDTAPSELVVT